MPKDTAPPDPAWEPGGALRCDAWVKAKARFFHPQRALVPDPVTQAPPHPHGRTGRMRFGDEIEWFVGGGFESPWFRGIASCVPIQCGENARSNLLIL